MDSAVFASRFWAKVDKRGPAECWPWLGSKLPDGRGQIWDGSRLISAPRAALILAGRDPGALDALHKNECHNPNCVNEAHLYAGTHQRNMQDAIDLGTFVKRHPGWGENNVNSVLTETDIIDIRSLAGWATKQGLADAFGVSRATIRKILIGKMWGHV